MRSPDPLDRALIDLLARDECGLGELAAALDADPAALRPKLDALDASGVLVSSPASPALDPVDAERYLRQAPFLADTGDPRALQRRLAASTVVVLGCGGLGTWALAALASAGVGRFRLVDDDAVALSNLNRQVLYGPEDLDRPKVDAAAAWLRAFDERIEVDARRLRVDEAAVPPLVDGADAVLLLADAPPYLLARWVNAACAERRIPFLTGGQLPPLLRVGPLYAAGRTACFACHESALRRESALYDEYVAHAQAATYRGATLGPASGIVGTMLAMELLQELVGERPATAGAAVILDIRTMATRTEPIPRDPDCDVCGAIGA